MRRKMSQVRQAGKSAILSARGTGTEARQTTAEPVIGTGTGRGAGTAAGTRTATLPARETTTERGGGVKKTLTGAGMELGFRV